jgi:hypothetical protein
MMGTIIALRLARWFLLLVIMWGSTLARCAQRESARTTISAAS